ncbi:MAG: DUF92 domain-containing protein, partial [Acidobacteriota bacterium]|nr:DUF92 domain-containing protein [Acidobacteriota bacterium]
SSGLTPLVLLFLLTFAATRAGRARKQRAGLAESRRGRTAAQVLANLAAAALFAACAALPAGVLQRHAAAACLAALAEATADTVSSELGQAFGGTPRMVLTLRPVPPGTDGAVSLLGTVSGVAGAAAIAMLGATALSLGHTAALGVLAAGTAGFLLDSLLGATLERAGVLGNDLVNFLSTVAAGLLALALKP